MDIIIRGPERVPNIREVTEILNKHMPVTDRFLFVNALLVRIAQLHVCVEVLADKECCFADQTRMADHIKRICGFEDV